MTVANTPEVLKPPVSKSGPIEWVKTNLTSTWYNAVLTVVMLALVIFFLRLTLSWVFFDANWDPVRSNLKLFLVGQYPDEEMWRVGVNALMVSLLMGVSWGRVAWHGAHLWAGDGHRHDSHRGPPIELG